MKNVWMTTLAVLSLLPFGALAVQKAENTEQAKAIVKDDGYMIFAYADGWDYYSKDTVEKMLAHEAVRKSIGDAVVMELAVPNVSTKEGAEEVKKRFAPLAVKNPSQYPAIYLYDKNGRLYSTICISYPDRKKFKKIARQIEARKEAGRKQAELLAQAEKAKGTERARLLGRASEIPDVERPDKVVDKIKKADPNDGSGYVRRLSHNPWATAEKAAKSKDWKEAMADVEKMLADPAYTADQKQALYATAIGLYHRYGGASDLSKIRDYARKMQDLDPDSVLGKSVPCMLREWAVGLNLQDGWSPSSLPPDKTPVEVEGPLPIGDPALYHVRFKWVSGSKGLTILAVELYDGGKKVAEDRHQGFAGIKETKPDYALNVGAPVKDPRLFITVDMAKSRDSSGKITITKQ